VSQISWKILRGRALDYDRSSDILKDHHLYQNALEQAYLSVEIAMKASIGRSGFFYPDRGPAGHDLIEIGNARVDAAKTLSSEIRSDNLVSGSFNKVLSVWNMQYRYEDIQFDKASIESFLKEYKVVYTWLSKKYLQ
jgi:hypothetical protein